MPRALRPRKKQRYVTKEVVVSEKCSADPEESASSECSTDDESEYDDDVIFKAIRKVRKSGRLLAKEKKQVQAKVIDNSSSESEAEEKRKVVFEANVICSRFLKRKTMKRNEWDDFLSSQPETTEQINHSVLRKHCPAFFKIKDKNTNAEEEVEKILVKWSNFSFIHCSWEEIEDLKQLSMPMHGKKFWDRKLRKMEEDGEVDQLLYCKVDRVLDNPDDEVLIKWDHLSYDSCTYEYRSDVLLFCDKAILEEKEEKHERRAFVKPQKNLTSYSSDMTFKNCSKLRSYQIQSVEWLTFNVIQGRNSILADEMGLGKTIQAICFMHRLCFSLKIQPRFLVIAPLATLDNWIREIEKWTDFYAVAFHGGQNGRRWIKEYELKKRFNILVTNFDLALHEMTYLGGFDWNLVVIDEAHRLKNDQSKLSIAIKTRLQINRCLLLTGTPIQNNLKELWTLLNFVDPKVFTKWADFEENWSDLASPEVMDDFQEMLRPYMLRRIKTDVEKLPPKEDTLVAVEMTTLQKRFYRAIYEKNRIYLKNAVSKAYKNDKLRIRNGVSLKNVAIQLRKCCSHPFLLSGVEDIVKVELEEEITMVKKQLKEDLELSLSFKKIQDNSTDVSDEEKKKFRLITESLPSLMFEKLVRSSGKLIFLDKLLPKLKRDGNRILMFSQWTRILDILEDYINGRNYTYERIDGAVQNSERQLAIDRFNNTGLLANLQKEETFIFLLSTKACGQGINLSSADTVIMFDGDWNPQNDLQALARCHRIGQQKTVHIYRLITNRSYEETMFHAAAKKLGLDLAITNRLEKTVDSSKSGDTKLSKSEQDKQTERLLKYGAFVLTEDDSKEKEFLNESIEHILKNRSVTIRDNAKDKLDINKLSKAKFGVNDANNDLDIADPQFWEKIVGVEGFDEKAYEHENIVHNKRKRKHVIYNPKVLYDNISISDSEYEDNPEDLLEETEGEDDVGINKDIPNVAKKEKKKQKMPNGFNKNILKRENRVKIQKKKKPNTKRSAKSLKSTQYSLGTNISSLANPIASTGWNCEVDPISGLIYKPAVVGALCCQFLTPSTTYPYLTSYISQSQCHVLKIMDTTYYFSEFYKFAFHQKLLKKVNNLKKIDSKMLSTNVEVSPQFFAKILDYIIGFGYQGFEETQRSLMMALNQQRLLKYGTTIYKEDWLKTELVHILKAVAIYVVLIDYNYLKFKKEPILIGTSSSSKKGYKQVAEKHPSLIPSGFFTYKDPRLDIYSDFEIEIPKSFENAYIVRSLQSSGYSHMASLFVTGEIISRIPDPVEHSWLITVAFDILWSAEKYYMRGPY